MGSMHSKYYGPEWRPNDGRVPLASALHPKNEPWQDFPDGYDYRGPVDKGIWNVFPVEEPKDHNFYIGEEVDPEEYKAYILQLGNFLAALDK